MSATPSPPHEETLTSERGFDGKLVHVRVDHVVLPSGKTSVREVVEHPGAVAIVAITSDDELILVRQWRHAVGRRLLEIPAGTREPGEPVEETTRRELREETGYIAGPTQQIARYYSSAGFCNEELTIFLAEGCAHGEQPEDIDERTEVVLVPIRDIGRLFDEGPDQLRDSKTLIGLLWLRSRAH